MILFYLILLYESMIRNSLLRVWKIYIFLIVVGHSLIPNRNAWFFQDRRHNIFKNQSEKNHRILARFNDAYRCLITQSMKHFLSRFNWSYWLVTCVRNFYTDQVFF